MFFKILDFWVIPLLAANIALLQLRLDETFWGVLWGALTVYSAFIATFQTIGLLAENDTK